MSKDTCVIGTRGSALARWQANAVAEALRAAVPGLAVEIRVISTTGDRVANKPLTAIGGKGLFTKELERALLAGEVDLCAHSMKDLPTELPTGCRIGAMLPRADAHDALVCGPRLAGVTSLAGVPAGARLGTGSRRRVAQLRANFPQVEPTPMRGNVDTRLAKAAGPDYEGAILAAAGLARMGRLDATAAILSVDQMVPAVGQGAIGIEVRADDPRAVAWCAAINDSITMACVAGERQVMRALQGGCQAPLGAYARMEGDCFVFDAVVLSADGSRVARSHREVEAVADHAKVAVGRTKVAAERTERAADSIELQAQVRALADCVLADLRAQGAEGILREVKEAGLEGSGAHGE